MFGLGTAELLIILFIALVVLGPKELPKVARTLGRGIRELQRAKDDIKKNIEFDDDMDEKTKFQTPKKDENV
ncbi:MAG: twin-arginine translocase TatA/TatE family subunit [Candidatus Dadabacteria bacterium]|nr:twin-arginine translocase TatA/TatE family subunit [Candidatus Dadabacteria bacterium]MDE0477722.1 twin-arginine translocase TatA/TatE family subunit [Candidatus Dadabacteria bacterium]